MNARARLSRSLALSASILATTMASGLLVANPAFAQATQFAQDQSGPVASQQELDQMLAPIALYPDELLTQILMASTYPLEVVQAARWSRANPGLNGDQAVRAVDNQNWDPSVKSLVAFPQVLELMDSTLDWTERLGNAFLSQEGQVWDTVQGLRQRANAAGNLQTTEQVRVIQEGPTYVIEPARPDIIYVPYYDPLIVYGDWWWPGYAPMRWRPWAGYYSRPGYGRGYYWGSGINVGFGFFFGGIDWRLRHVNVVNHNSFYYRNVRNRAPDNRWQHDPDHRRGVPYRNPVLRQQFNRAPGTPDARRDYRGRGDTNGNTQYRQGDRTQNDGQRADRQRGDRGGRQPGGQAGQQQAVQPGTQRQPQPVVPGTNPDTRSEQKYPSVRGGGARSRGEPVPQALDGVGSGQDARNASSRGQASYPGRQITLPQQQQQRAPQVYNAPVAPRQQVQPQVQAPQMQQRVAPQVQLPQAQPQQQQQQAPAQHNNGPRQRGEQR
ncbi:MAG: DUF3300 domain-containing protein [Betaproteobacteria bacterium]